MGGGGIVDYREVQRTWYKRKKTHSRRGHFLLRNLLGAVWIIHQVTHGNKRVAESFGGRDSFVGVEAEHALQEVYKLPSVGLLG